MVCFLFALPRVALATTEERGDPANASDENATGAAACGDVEIRTDMKCTLDVSGSCTAHCDEGTRFAAACNARCAGKCSQSSEAGCRQECGDSCKSSCESGGFECSAHCGGACEGECTEKCGDDTACGTRCQASCSAQCDL